MDLLVKFSHATKQPHRILLLLAGTNRTRTRHRLAMTVPAIRDQIATVIQLIHELAFSAPFSYYASIVAKKEFRVKLQK